MVRKKGIDDMSKTKTTYINARGETVDLDLNDGDVIPSGFGIRTPSFLMDGDGVQQAIAANSRATVTDGLGNRAGSRPGHAYLRDDDEAEARARAAYNAHREYLKDAWRNPGAAVSDQTPEAPEAAREAYKVRLSNAWKTTSGTGFGPGSFGAGG